MKVEIDEKAGAKDVFEAVNSWLERAPRDQGESFAAIITALRGPDSIKDGPAKMDTTCVIRAMVMPGLRRFGLDVSGAIETTGPNQDLGQAILSAREKAADPEGHWGGHIRSAVAAMGRLGYIPSSPAPGYIPASTLCPCAMCRKNRDAANSAAADQYRKDNQ